MHSNLSQSSSEFAVSHTPLVLIVDNDLDNLLLAKYVVESMGINCLTTGDSQQCLTIVREASPNLILLDVLMPHLSGIEIVEQIRSSVKVAETKVIAVTGLSKPEDIALLTDAGFDDYLCKPYLIEDLEAKIRFLLNFPAV